MLKEERQTWILNKLHTSGKVVVSHLAGELKVSEDTIRRDLLDLWKNRSSTSLTGKPRMLP